MNIERHGVQIALLYLYTNSADRDFRNNDSETFLKSVPCYGTRYIKSLIEKDLIRKTNGKKGQPDLYELTRRGLEIAERISQLYSESIEVEDELVLLKRKNRFTAIAYTQRRCGSEKRKLKSTGNVHTGNAQS